MSPKLFLFTAFGLSLLVILVLQWRMGARRIAFTMLLVSVACWVAGPWAYKLWPGGIFARPTISWPEVTLLFSLVVMFTPASGRRLTDFAHSDFDKPIPTDRAPLSAEPPRYH